MKAIRAVAILACGWAALGGAQGMAEEKGAITVSAQDVPVRLPDGKLDKIWSGVVIATNAASPKEAPPELRELAPRLKRVFGYNQFELFGSATELIDETVESWLVPSQNFWLGVKARRAVSKEARGGYLLNLQLFQDKRQIVVTEAKLAPDSPLIIRGPQYGKGQLLIVLQVKK